MISNLENFLLGVFATLCLVAGAYFFKFWRKTRDPLFLAFAASFCIRSLNNAAKMSLSDPNTASTWSVIVGLLASLLIVIAILRKNLDGNRR